MLRTLSICAQYRGKRQSVFTSLAFFYGEQQISQITQVFFLTSGTKGLLPLLSASKRSHETSAEAVKAAEAEAKESKRLAEFRKKLRETTPITDLGTQSSSQQAATDPLPPWPDNTNPHTGEVGGPRGPEPTRYGDWERKGRVSDF